MKGIASGIIQVPNGVGRGSSGSRRITSSRNVTSAGSSSNGTQRCTAKMRVDEIALTRAIETPVSGYGHHGYRWITSLLNVAGWNVGTDQVQRIWRRERLRLKSTLV